MQKTEDSYLKAVLRLSDRDIQNLREFEATWDVRTEQFNPSVQPLPQLIRSLIENLQRLDKPRKQAVQKRKTQKD